MSPCASSSRTASCSRGFTLVELLLVVTILSAVAWMSTSVLMDSSDQLRFDDTRNRLQAIRRSILGDSTRTMNGSPVISGYVADMGALPPSLAALLSREYCSGKPKATTPAACAATPSGTWVSQATHAYDATHGLWHGWNGPYLTAAELIGYPKFQDGWGNDDGLVNFGWRYTLDTSTGDLTIQSYGRDGPTGTGTDAYDSDYPPTTVPPTPYIRGSEYRVEVTDSAGNGGLSVDFGIPVRCWKCTVDPATYQTRQDCVTAGGSWVPDAAGDSVACGGVNGVWLPPTPTASACIGVAHRNGGAVSVRKSGSASFSWDGVTRQVLQFQFPDPDLDLRTFAQGQSSFTVYKYDGTTCTDTPFTAGATGWRVFSVLPGAAMQPLTWEVR